MSADNHQVPIEIRGLTKHFGSVRALDGLDLTVREGEVHGFLGPNGAGKSTTLRILLGLVKADGGSVRLLGGDPWTDAVDLHRHIAYVPGDVTLWPSLTGGETIDLLARMRGGIDNARRAELIERFGLDPTKKARTYSKGNRQKVSLISALSSHATLLLLDEPSSGLDPLMENAAVHRRSTPTRCDGAVVQPYSGRDRSAVRKGDHHPSRQDRRKRFTRRLAAPQPHLDQGRNDR